MMSLKWFSVGISYLLFCTFDFADYFSVAKLQPQRMCTHYPRPLTVSANRSGTSVLSISQSQR